jgi:hypothetical protein
VLSVFEPALQTLQRRFHFVVADDGRLSPQRKLEVTVLLVMPVLVLGQTFAKIISSVC